jgi:pyruvate dehydrogenase E2 component (dihydrolipoamide acetyltransferase)
MATEVVMPQMGESITEGTITKWLKKIGEKVERDEMIFEISTDKVDAEIPSPVSGVLLEIRGNEGDTLEVGTVVAIVGEEGEAGAATPSAPAASTNGTQAATAPQAQSAGVEAEQESAEAMDAQVPGIAVADTPVAPPAPVEASQTAAPASSDNATEVVMPQMGESITEGTITKWLKKVGDKVERDEMIFEISTDKVDAEIKVIRSKSEQSSRLSAKKAQHRKSKVQSPKPKVSRWRKLPQRRPLLMHLNPRKPKPKDAVTIINARKR